MKCPVCGQNSWRTVVRKENSTPAALTFVTALYRVCTRCNYEEKMQSKD
jgi:C4-type Zn-finger protein